MRVLKIDGSSFEVSDEEILYFSTFKNTVFVHTQVGEFILPTTLSDIFTAYADLGFVRLDRNNVVNTRKIEGYDPERKIVLFHHQEQFATVSESNKASIEAYLTSKQKEPGS